MAAIFDFDTRTIREIPAAELAPGYTLGRVEGVPGQVYVSMDQVRGRATPTQRHGGLSDECHRVIRLYMGLIGEADGRTFEEHVAGFCQETDPVRELYIHFKIAKVYEHFTRHKIVSIVDRKALFQLLLSCTMANRDTVRFLVDIKRIGRVALDRIVEHYFDYSEQRASDDFTSMFDATRLYPLDFTGGPENTDDK